MGGEPLAVAAGDDITVLGGRLRMSGVSRYRRARLGSQRPHEGLLVSRQAWRSVDLLPLYEMAFLVQAAEERQRARLLTITARA